MLINPYTSVVNATLSGGKTPAAELKKSVDQLSSGQNVRNAVDDVAGLSVATGLQNNVAGLRSALGTTAQFTSAAQVADAGVAQIQDTLGQLQNSAVQARSEGDAGSRAVLNAEFQAALDTLDSVAASTRFNDTNLLDGSLSGDNALSINAALGEDSNADNARLAVESLRASDLLGENVNILSEQSAEQALSSIQQALNSVGTTRASIGSFAQQVDFTSAYVETAIANQDAARSTISDADFTAAATALSEASLKQNVQTAVQAQGNRLPPSMLELIR